MKLFEFFQANKIFHQLPGDSLPEVSPGYGAALMNQVRVILVDDNPNFLAVSREFLDAHDGIEVVGTATSGADALALIESARPIAVVTDLVMPGINGFELTQQIKARWPEVHVIIMTMHDTVRHRDAAIEAGASGFVTKAKMDSDLVPALGDLSAGSTVH